MNVSELARSAGVTPDAVRHYARIGLLAPARDADYGYRRFNAADHARLRFMLQAKRLGFQLDEIAQILGMSDGGRTPCPVMRQIIQRRIVETRQRLAEMHALQARLQQALVLWANMPDGERDGNAVCTLIEATGNGHEHPLDA